MMNPFQFSAYKLALRKSILVHRMEAQRQKLLELGTQLHAPGTALARGISWFDLARRNKWLVIGVFSVAFVMRYRRPGKLMRYALGWWALYRTVKNRMLTSRIGNVYGQK